MIELYLIGYVIALVLCTLALIRSWEEDPTIFISKNIDIVVFTLLSIGFSAVWFISLPAVVYAGIKEQL